MDEAYIEQVPNLNRMEENHYEGSICKEKSNPAIDTVGNSNTTETDPFAYLERSDFTSEKFKIEIRNLPKRYGLRELKKLLNQKLKLGSNKIKVPSKNSFWIYVCFRSEEDKKKAIETLNGYKWKGNVLSADTALAVPDPLVKKRMLDRGSEQDNNKKLKLNAGSEKDKLMEAVAPLSMLPYEEQLVQKKQVIFDVLKSLGDELVKVNPELGPIIKAKKEKYNGLPCEVWPIRHAELTSDGYRNKCEFTIGINEGSGLRTIGFRLGSYVTGSVAVAPIDDVPNVPKRMKEVVSIFQNFIRNSDLDVFHPVKQEGFWRQLTVRYGFRTDQLMLIVGVHPQKLTDCELKKIMEDIKQFFSEGDGKSCEVTSLFVQLIEKKKSQEDETVYHHIMGEKCIYEKLLNRNFRISPQAFFQINTSATEVLYNSIAELAGLNENVTLLDICCGTGSIGICLSDKCGEVLGLEISSKAVEDAKENAAANNIKNAQFFAGKAEEILSSVAFRASNDTIIAIADPPRAGLHQNALVQLRKSQHINKLVYVSCEPKLAVKNFIALGRAPSKMYQREPFLPVKAVPVDLFPHTKHCELLIYFERVLTES
ncbi:UNVERIFIED_CONTAM: hypothetical protein PYX00_005262 [Menopon gallinae]|uniref:tRNA (uracil(54)-C(5))-methyltransferase n=1 Tax=Menopon gallinae TaxID=328185 RepID=A0AAW2HRU6_9NEOP